MSGIPSFIQFSVGAAAAPQHLSDIDSFDPDTSDLDENDSASAMLLDEGKNDLCSRHHQDEYETANITSQDLDDLKAMVQRMKSNPALITNKLNELKSSWTTQKTAATQGLTVDTNGVKDVSPLMRGKETVGAEEYNNMKNSKSGNLLSFPILPIP